MMLLQVVKGALIPETHASLYEEKKPFKVIYYKDPVQLDPIRQK